MSLERHRDALLAKHQKLEQQIESEMQRPLPDQVAIQALKRQKLQLKDSAAQFG